MHRYVPAAPSRRPPVALRAAAAVVTVALAALLGPAAALATATAAGAAPAKSVTAGMAPASAASGAWTVSWEDPAAWGYGIASDVTVRQIAHLSAGGTAVRVRVSNVFGDRPLTVVAASIGLQSTGAAVVPGSLLPLTFAGQPQVTIPVGQFIYSDAAPLVVHDGSNVAVSLYVPGADLVSVHPCCQESPRSYFTANGGGDTVDSLTGSELHYSSTWMRWVDAVDVSDSPVAGATVILGDSISDGFNTALRWPDLLVRRLSLLPADKRVAVANAAITANTLTAVYPSYALLGGGPPGVTRLNRDVLSQPGISRLVVLLGTNDLWFGATATQVITGLQQVIAAAHAAGIPVIVSTLLPRARSKQWTPQEEIYRQEVNAWIRSTGSIDAVIDFAAVVADVYDGSCDTHAMFPPYNSGDFLHPGPAGQTAMADAVPTTLLGAGAAPRVPEMVSAIPTRGCLQRPVVLIRNPQAFAAHPAPAVSSATPSDSPTLHPSATPTRSRAVAADPPGPAGTTGSGGINAGDVAAATLVGVAALGGVALRRRAVQARRQHRRQYY